MLVKIDKCDLDAGPSDISCNQRLLDEIHKLINSVNDIDSGKDCELGSRIVTKVCDFLTAGKTEINQSDSQDQTLLFTAVCQNDVQVVKILIACGANVNQRGTVAEYGLRLLPICQAIRCNNVAIAAALTDAGAELCGQDYMSSPLHLAVNYGDEEMLEHLLSAGCSVNHRTYDNCLTPLHLACRMGQPNIVKLLLEHGADANLCETTERQSAAYFTCNLDILQLLLSYGLDINLTTRSGESILHRAIIKGQENLVEFLVDNGAELNITQNRYQFYSTNVLQRWAQLTPFRLAVEEGYFSIAECLTRHGCNLQDLKRTGVDTLERIINHTNKQLLMLVVFAAGNWQWTQLVQYDRLSHFHGDEELSCVWDWLSTASQNPFTLKQLCRCAIRELLQKLCANRSVQQRIQCLPLPPLLRDYVSLIIL